MLAAMGLERETVRFATVCENAYQFSMRTSLRDPTSTEAVQIIVPGRPEAEWLAAALGAPPPRRIDLGIPEGVKFPPPHRGPEAGEQARDEGHGKHRIVRNDTRVLYY
jgi:hypothetical protein